MELLLDAFIAMLRLKDADFADAFQSPKSSKAVYNSDIRIFTPPLRATAFIGQKVCCVMKADTDQHWYTSGTIRYTDEEGRHVLPPPLREHEIEELVLDATHSEPSTMEAHRVSDGIDSGVSSTSHRGGAGPLLNESDRLSDEKYSSPRSPSPNGAAEPLAEESDRLTDEDYSVVGCPCDMSACPEARTKPLIMKSARSSDEKHSVVESPSQRSPSPGHRAATLFINSDRAADRQCGIVMPPSPKASAEPSSIMGSDHSSDKHFVAVMPPSPEDSEYASSPHHHSKSSPGFSDSSSSSDVAETMQPTVPEPGHLKPGPLRSASTISLYSLQGDADRSNRLDRSPSRRLVERTPTADSEPFSPTSNKPDEVVVAALSDTISPISPKHLPLADDIPLVELKKDAPFVDFELHLQHRKQRLKDAQAVFAMPGGDGSSDGGDSNGSGEARRGFSYLDNGAGNLPAKPSCGLC
ncbi:hypothetical protein AC579_4040 [Pseudocercospora musae]|uniref:Uncharacterized protein n=1 Tax=Pseudocercospora musae TaxID=113226 RepID=A0A139IEA9_9PEZI|nr:hypothetical protein AC579_4040 [Pseudocercospora musae]